MGIGKLLENIRVKEKITRGQLSKGICSQQMIYKFEIEQSEPSMLMFEMLMERLGKCTDNLEFILSYEAYNKISKRREIDELILHSNQLFGQSMNRGEALEDYKKNVVKLLEEYRETIEKNDMPGLMYYYRTKADALYRLGTRIDLKEALISIENALYTTIPDWKDTIISNKLLSIWELENLLVYVLLQMEIEEESQYKNLQMLLEEILIYIESHFNDTEMKCRIFPKCVYVMTQIYADKSDLMMIQRCEDAMELLRDNGILYLMEPILAELIDRLQCTCNQERADYWEKFKNKIGQINQIFYDKCLRDSMFFRWSQCEYHLDYEIIRSERMAQGISQEELSYGVFSNRASLSYLENGKSEINHSKFGGLMKKLNFEKNRVDGFVVTNTFDMMEMLQNLRKSVSLGDFISSRELLLSLKENIDYSNSNNHRICEAYECLIEYMESDIDNQSLTNRLYSLAMQTFDLEAEIYHRYPLRNEMDIILFWMGINKDLHKAHLICKKLIEALNKSEVRDIYHYRTFMGILYTYVIYEAELKLCGDLGEAYYKSMVYGIACGKGGSLSSLYWGLALGNSEPDLKREALYGSYIFADLYNEQFAELKKERYEALL